MYTMLSPVRALVPTECDVSNVVTSASVGTLELCWWILVAEQHLRRLLVVATALLKLLVKCNIIV